MYSIKSIKTEIAKLTEYQISDRKELKLLKNSFRASELQYETFYRGIKISLMLNLLNEARGKEPCHIFKRAEKINFSCSINKNEFLSLEIEGGAL